MVDTVSLCSYIELLSMIDDGGDDDIGVDYVQMVVMMKS